MPVVVPYVLVVLIWSSTPLAIQWSALETGFTFAAMSRMVLALGCVIAVLVVARIPLGLSRRALGSYGCAGVGLFLAMVSVYWAASRMDSGLMSVIFGLSPWSPVFWLQFSCKHEQLPVSGWPEWHLALRAWESYS